MHRLEWETLAAVVAAGGLFTLLERRFAYNRGQPFLRDGFWNDLILYCFVQSYVLGVLIGRLVAFLDARGGFSRLHLVSAWPLLVQLALFTVLHDLYIYFFHRWQHRSPLLWRFHEAHHSVRSVDWLSGVRSHSAEILINQTVEFGAMVFLGATPAVIVIKGAVSAIWGMLIHSNVDLRLGPLQYVFNGPAMHRWHHADDARAYDRNFATKLAIWDWIFGTAWYPAGGREKAARYGLPDRDYPEAFPLGYFAQHALAFRSHGEMAAETVHAEPGGAAASDA